MFDASYLKAKFSAADTFDEYVRTGSASQQQAWREVYERSRLAEPQRKLLANFSREMNVLVCSGIWCGDCVQQCPLLVRISDGNPERIRVRFLDRDGHADLSSRLRINGGVRVPVVLLLAEDFELCSIAGDRTLARYRALARRQLGDACPLPQAPVAEDELEATLGDWLAEVERVQWMLRLSGRLRERHGD